MLSCHFALKKLSLLFLVVERIFQDKECFLQVSCIVSVPVEMIFYCTFVNFGLD